MQFSKSKTALIFYTNYSRHWRTWTLMLKKNVWYMRIQNLIKFFLVSSTSTGNEQEWNQMKNKLRQFNAFSLLNANIHTSHINLHCLYRVTMIIWHFVSCIGKFSNFWLQDYVIFSKNKNYLNCSCSHYFLTIFYWVII